MFFLLPPVSSGPSGRGFLSELVGSSSCLSFSRVASSVQKRFVRSARQVSIFDLPPIQLSLFEDRPDFGLSPTDLVNYSGQAQILNSEKEKSGSVCNTRT